MIIATTQRQVPSIINARARILAGSKVRSHRVRQLATVAPDISIPIPTLPSLAVTRSHPFDDAILRHLSTRSSDAFNSHSKHPTSLNEVLQQYDTRSGRVLDAVLPNNPLPWKTPLEAENVDDRLEEVCTGTVLVAHVVQDGDIHDLEVSSGFCVQLIDGAPCVVTCAHTLEQVSISLSLIS